jgi:flavin reductase (DIM6/NTAB) family NADH-FMN oxidoreductase RutF
MPIDDAGFKAAMSHFVSGVTIVTTEHEGSRYGMTVASFASLSLHPPLVIVCVEKSVKTHDGIVASGKFGVSILGQSQKDVSGRFASKVDDKFTGVAIRNGELGLPLIDGALCTLECRVYAQLPGGDHTVFAGEVIHADTPADDGKPLVYYRSNYHELA